MKSIPSKILRIGTLLIFLTSCSDSKEEASLFNYPSVEETGIDFTNQLTPSADQNILDYLYFYNGGGVSIGDINNDGLPDIYLTGNQVKNKLYLNKGNLKFEDITEKAEVAGSSSWTTGTTMADVNGDGLLDIYVCAVVGINGFRGHNELFINNGPSTGSGQVTFTEKAAEFGLDIENYSSQAAFFDMDDDGDLDMYLLNHAVHTANSYGPATIREKRVEESGDKLFRNDNGKFVDISTQAGIYGGANSYGLGITTADFNNDGFVDIYIGNDFHEDDYFYLNNGDGTFTESLESYFGHVSRFSMGSDAADINNDGYVDLITLDMLPSDEQVLKSSAGDDNVNVDKIRQERFGYKPQYSRNMLQINQAGQSFSEEGLMRGVAATDWSWSALFADYNQDGLQDLFISNGIPKRPNNLDYIKYTSDENIRKKLDQTHLVDQKALDEMPSGKLSNIFFLGHANGNFTNESAVWLKNDSISSTGTAYADLDNDGDLDLVTNNINAMATLYENTTNSADFIQFSLDFGQKNTFGLGSRIMLYSGGTTQTRQLFTTKGFQSSSQPFIHFGLAKETQIDSALVIWPDRTYQRLNALKRGEKHTIKPDFERDTLDFDTFFGKNKRKLFARVEDNLGIDYVHHENRFIDFNRQNLIPHQISDRGPATAVGDMNGDALDDIYFGASRFGKGAIYYQTATGFRQITPTAIARDSITEDTDAVIADFNGDKKADLFVTSGGGEFRGESEWLRDRLYLAEGENNFKKDTLAVPNFGNSAVVKAADYDQDGAIDLFVGVDGVAYDYGRTPASYLLHNDNGTFTQVKQAVFEDLGMVTDALWTDFNHDDQPDLIVVGEWMTPRFLKNDNGTFKDVTSDYLDEKLSGLWQSIFPFDAEGDGDEDYLLGNWGLNTKFTASPEYPLLMYYADFDDNGSTETLLAQEKDGKYFMPYGLDELATQLNSMKKKFTKYADYAGKSIEEVIGKSALEKAKKYEVHQLASGYLENTGNRFRFKEFPQDCQVAPIRAFVKYDFDQDGSEDVLMAGNYFGVSPYHGKFDALNAGLLSGKGDFLNPHNLGVDFARKAVKKLQIVNFKESPYLLATLNNDTVQVYQIQRK